ncbi:MAG: TonB-dependent receptor [Firmicutes bacterium]|nr:TonB-dependent receptor [Bacillota bacterium]
MKRIMVIVLTLLSIFAYPVLASTKASDIEPIVVVVTGSLLPAMEEETPAVVQTIPPEVVQAAEDLPQLLADHVGIDLHANRPTPGGVATLRIWGSTPTQVLVLLDGVPLNTPWDGMVDLSLLPLDAVERIEVQKGGSSSLYGNAAVGGVVNIITKKGFKPQNEVQVAAGSYNEKELAVTTAGPVDEVTYYRLNVGTDSGEGPQEHSAYRHNTLFASLDRDLSEYATASFTILGYDADVQIPPIPWGPGEQGNQRFRLTGHYSYEDLTGLTWKGALWLDSDHLTYETETEQSDHRLATLGYSLIRSKSDEDGGISLATDGLVTRVNSTNVVGQKTITNQGIFAEKTGQLADWNYSVSGRLDLHSNFGLHLSPRLGFSRPLSGGTFKVNLGSSFKAPTANDLYWESTYGSGNPNLSPERAWSLEAQYLRVRSSWEWSVAAFYRYVQDMIAWPYDETAGKWVAQNIDEMKVKGTELSASRTLGKTLKLTGNLTLLSAEGAAVAVNPLAPVEYSLGLCYTPSTRLRTDLKLRGAGQRYNGVAAYTVVDSSVAYTLNPQTRLTLSITNLMNEEYQLNEGYTMPGRRIQAGVTYSF